jgi:hypothetical protein
VGPWARGPEKDDLIAKLIVAQDPALIRALYLRFLEEQPSVVRPGGSGGRTVAMLLRLAEDCAAERKQIKADSSARQKAVREQDAAIAREAHLDRLVGQEPRLWVEVEALVATRQPKHYDQAVKLLLDLRDMGFRNKAGDFSQRLEQLRTAQAQKPALLKRIRQAGL